MNAPPLATTSPDGTPSNQAGVLGEAGTKILFGNSGLNDRARTGGQFTLGTWLDCRQCRGFELTYLFLGANTDSFLASNNDISILARPFFNVQNNSQDARRIAFPGEVSGALDIQSNTELQVFEALFRSAGKRVPSQRIDYLLGYRFAELEDQIGIRETTVALAAPIAGTSFDLLDDFRTRNTFHGGEVGVVIACQEDTCWSCEMVAKLALGSTQSRASVFGETTTTVGGASTTTQAGLLAQSTNSGTFEQSSFSTVSEVGITLKRHLYCGPTVTFGYTFLHWSDVARAGDQIDLGINTSQIPPGTLTGTARPAFPFANTGFWAQGIRFGIEHSY